MKYFFIYSVYSNKKNITQTGYILLTFLFFLVAASALFFTSNIYNRNTTNTFNNYNQLTQIKSAVLSIIATGRDALDNQSTYGGINDYPGIVPCPERTQDIGSSNEGSSRLRWCHTSNSITTNNFGRIPFRRYGLGRVIDSSGDRAWIILDPNFSRGNIPTVSSSREINNSTTQQLKWDDGGGEEYVAAIIFSPNKTLSTQDRSQLSSTNPPVYTNYLEISDPTASLNGGEVIITKQDNSNDDYVTISRKEWLDVTQTRVGNAVIHCLDKFADEWAIDNNLTFPEQTSFNQFSISSTTPSIIQASNDICSNIFNRIEHYKADPTIFNKVYQILEDDSKHRACCFETGNSVPVICFNPDDNEYGSITCSTTEDLPAGVDSTVTVSNNGNNEDETKCAMIKILPDITNSSTFDCPSITDCSIASNKDQAICKNDRWLAQWTDEIFYRANKDGNQDMKVYLEDDTNFVETDMLVIVGSESAPVARTTTTNCSTIANKTKYPYIIIGTDKFCLDEEDRIGYRNQ